MTFPEKVAEFKRLTNKPFWSYDAIPTSKKYQQVKPVRLAKTKIFQTIGEDNWKAFRNQIAGRKLRQRRQKRICSMRKWTATKMRSGWKSKPKRDERPEKFPPFCETVAKKEEAEGGKLFAARADQNRNNFLNDELSGRTKTLKQMGMFFWAEKDAWKVNWAAGVEWLNS